MASSAAASSAEREVHLLDGKSHAAVLALLGKAVPLLTKAREVMEGVEVMTRQVERAKDAQCIALTAQKNMLAGEIPEASYKSKLLFAKDACVNVTGQAQKLNEEIRELETRWDHECQEEACAAEDWLAINLKDAEAELDACRRVLGDYACVSLVVAAYFGLIIFAGLVHILAAFLRLEGWEPGSLGPLLAGKLAFCKWWWTTVPARIAEINSARSNMVDPILEVREQIRKIGSDVSHFLLIGIHIEENLKISHVLFWENHVLCETKQWGELRVDAQNCKKKVSGSLQNIYHQVQLWQKKQLQRADLQSVASSV